MQNWGLGLKASTRGVLEAGPLREALTQLLAQATQAGDSAGAKVAKPGEQPQKKQPSAKKKRQKVEGAEQPTRFSHKKKKIASSNEDLAEVLPQQPDTAGTDKPQGERQSCLYSGMLPLQCLDAAEV